MSPIDTTPVRSRIADRYTVLSLLGVGGMGSVYRVHDDALDEVVALKLLRRELLDDPRERARFRQEVKLARRVAHPNVARVFDFGEAGGDIFLTMEFVEGMTLATRIGRDAPLPIAEVATLGLALCAGLGAVHSAGIVHRDFKPENVLIGEGGRVALTDFGIARAGNLEGALVQTQGLILGTPDYMAPEQVEDQANLDARTDLFALGVVLFELATGQRPFRAPTPLATAVARLTTRPTDPRDLRPDLTSVLADLINDCLQRDRARRPESTDAVAMRLEALGTGRTLSMAPPTVVQAEPLPRPLPGPELRPAAPGEKKVAVMPFRNLGAAEDAFLADGLADDVADTLAGLSGLRVRPRATFARTAQEHDDPIAFGRALEVDVVVEGTVRRQGDMVRVSARLFCTLNGFALWAQRFEGSVADVFGLSDRVAEGVAGALSVRAAEARTPVQDSQAMELYLRGRRAYHTFWREDAAEAVELLAEAARRSPENATILSAYAMALARAYAIDAAGPDVHERLAAACDAVLARAPQLAGPHVARASLHFQNGDPVAAGRELREALLAKADLADGRELLGRMLTELGELDAGIGHLHVARALEPAMHHTTLSVARAEALRGQPHLADSLLVGPQAVGVTPSLLWIARVRLAMWRRDTAAADRIETEMAGLDFPMRAQVQATVTAIRAPHLAQRAIAMLVQVAVVHTGATPRLRAFFAQLVAEFRALAGERPAAIAALVEADALGLVDVAWLDHCPLFIAFENDPAFVAVRERVRARARLTLDALAGR